MHAEEKLLHEGGVDVDEVGEVLQEAQDRLAGDAGAVQQDLPVIIIVIVIIIIIFNIIIINIIIST